MCILIFDFPRVNKQFSETNFSIREELKRTKQYQYQLHIASRFLSTIKELN